MINDPKLITNKNIDITYRKQLEKDQFANIQGFNTFRCSHERRN